ncbi:MAG: ABC transporter permease [Verrucomicrobiota bacterium]|nr:ABC transporter permease [Verrucomicrobiota bacterium]
MTLSNFISIQFHHATYALQLMRKQPGITLMAIGAMALGIGMVTVQFSMLNGILLSNLPVREGERIYMLLRMHKDGNKNFSAVPPLDLEDWRKQIKSFDSLCAFRPFLFRNVSQGEEAHRYNLAYVSANWLIPLEVQPMYGRNFTEADDQFGAEPTIILSYHKWKSDFSSDPTVVGRSIKVNGMATTILGVMPDGFRFPVAEDGWQPMQLHLDKAMALNRSFNDRYNGQMCMVYGRLKEGISLEQAETELDGLVKQLAATFPDSHGDFNSARIIPYTAYFSYGDNNTTVVVLLIMFASAILLLFTACANVANLLLARASTRTRELAVRAALGAGPWTIATQMLVESVLIAVVGAGLGTLLAIHGSSAIFDSISSSDTIPYWMHVRIDPLTLIVTIFTTALAGLIAGMLPAWKAAHTNLNELLKDGGRSGSGWSIGRFSRALVIIQIALCFTLVVASALMTKSIINSRKIQLGYELNSHLMGQTILTQGKYADEFSRGRFYSTLRQRIRENPDVASVAITDRYQISGINGMRYLVEGTTYASEKDYPFCRAESISPDYFKTLGVPLVNGREFAETDISTTERVCIVNQRFAETNFPKENPLGKRIRMDWDKEHWMTIVGICPTLEMRGLSPSQRYGDGSGIYTPTTDRARDFATILIRPKAGDPLRMAAILRETVTALDSEIPVMAINVPSYFVEQETHSMAVVSEAFVVSAIIGIFMTSLGLYGVVSFYVNQRRQEIGIRMALGARPEHVIWQLGKETGIQLIIGLLLGLTLCFLTCGTMRAILFEVNPFDPVILSLVTLLISFITAVACYGPTRRALKVSPAVSLRAD